MNGHPEHLRLNREADAYFRFNGKPCQYSEPQNLEYSRTGTVVNLNTPTVDKICVAVVPVLSPSLEQVTAFGSLHQYRIGQQAILKVLAADLIPELKGSFWIDERRFEVIGVKPEYRGAELWRFDVLLGYA